MSVPIAIWNVNTCFKQEDHDQLVKMNEQRTDDSTQQMPTDITFIYRPSC